MNLLRCKQLTKTVNYHGCAIAIPVDHKWVCTQPNGKVYSSANRFIRAGAFGFDIGYTLHVADVDLEGTPWQDTLVEYPL